MDKLISLKISVNNKSNKKNISRDFIKDHGFFVAKKNTTPQKFIK